MHRCPRTGQALEISAGRLASPDGDVSYELHHEVAVFQQTGVEDPSDAARLDRLNDRARKVGYLNAIAEAQRAGESLMHYVVGPDRHAYVDLLSIDQDSRVLEIGCSLGQCTTLLARRAGEVHAMDVVRGQAEFTLLRCREDGLTNVRVAAGGEDARLPYQDGTFDVVVLNLVLEWCGSRSVEEHRVVQRRMLSEISRVLKPGGRAWISTKNRYSIRLLLGGRDEHISKIRFGSALPRWMGRLGLMLCGRRRSEGHLHSHRSLRSLILRSGFDSTEAYWAIPDMRHPLRYVRADAGSIQLAREEHGLRLCSGRLASWLMAVLPAWLVPHVAPGNCFVARKHGVTATDMPESVGDTRQRLPAAGEAGRRDYRRTG